MLKIPTAFLCCAFATMVAGQARSDTALISRESLFSSPVRSASRISPDAKWLSWLAPLHSSLNLWLAPVRHLDRAQLLTHDLSAYTSYAWAFDNRHLIYLQDKNGDGRTHLFAIDMEQKAARDLTPIADTRAAIVALSPKEPNEVAISLYRDDPKYGDLYKIDLHTGALTLLLKNHEYLSFLLNDELFPLLAIKRESSNDETVVRLSDGRPLMEIPATDVRTTRLLSIDSTGRKLFLLDSRDRDKAGLAEIDVRTGKEKLLAEDDRADIQDVALDVVTREPEFYSVNIARTEYHALLPQFRPDLAFLAHQGIGEWYLNDQSKDGRFWKITAISAKATIPYLYDRKNRSLTKLYEPRPSLLGAPLVDMQTVTVRSRVGQNLISYLLLPKDSDADGKGIPGKPLPMVLAVHGGPHDRDSYGFNPVYQWLANRGYAVLSVNMRGSTGFGKSFLNASSGEWGTKLDDDLIDAVHWAVRSKIADPNRIAIMGGSYGGYAVLRGMTRDTDAYACGIDMYGPADLTTMQGPGTTYGVSALNHNEVGDPSTAEGLAHMREQSPLFEANKIRKPLLVAQGANDPAVKPSLQSDKLVAAIEANHGTVTYLLYPDEGHGFVRPANNFSFYAVSEQFLAKCLGGRAEPLIPESLKGSSMEVMTGADQIPGLQAALDERNRMSMLPPAR